MSAIRHDRRGLRAMQASPYARPTKKSSWSFSSLLSYLNPLRLGSWNEDPNLEESSEVLPMSLNSAETGDVGQAVEGHTFGDHHATMVSLDSNYSQQPLDPPRNRLRPSTTSRPKRSDVTALRLDGIEESSPSQNIEIVTKFLEERGGKPMSNVELEGVISLLRRSTQPEKREPFRFSFSASPTPGRSNSPDAVGTTPNTEVPRAPKMMTKNPNGVYRWRGGGSARPARSRNRYTSPAFGPSRSTHERLVLKDNTATGEGFRAENKRRRVDDHTVGSSMSLGNGPALDKVAAPDSSNPKTTILGSNTTTLPHPASGGAQFKNNGTLNNGSSFRGLQKPTTPAVPSPLRQAWSGLSSDVYTIQSPPTPPKPTKAANLMAELIKEVTPPKKPDVSNPYQTASPVKIIPSSSKPRLKRSRPPTQSDTTKPSANTLVNGEETNVEKVTPQAIIEATLPKGSKRARPPARFDDHSIPESSTVAPLESAASDTNLADQASTAGTLAAPSCAVEEADEDEEARTGIAKKPKPYLNGRGAPGRRAAHDEIIIEEVTDVEMSNANAKLASKSLPLPLGPTAPIGGAPSKGPFSQKPSSIPKEPSKLRFSYQPECLISETTSTIPETKQEETSTLQVVATKTLDAKAFATSLPISSLPIFTFTFAAITTFALSPEERLAREQAMSEAESSLPTIIFSSKLESVPSADTMASSPVKAFDWSAAGITPPPTGSVGGNWTCSICMLSNPASATEKCTICEAPR